MRHAFRLFFALCALSAGGAGAAAETPIEFRAPPQGLSITYEDGRTFTFGATVDRLTDVTVTGPHRRGPFQDVLRDVFFYERQQTADYDYQYTYRFAPDRFTGGASIWPLDNVKTVRANYFYALNGTMAGVGDVMAATGAPETVTTPAGTFDVRRVMIMYESRPMTGALVAGTAVCLYAPAIGYCVGMGALETNGATRYALAVKIERPGSLPR